MKFEELTQANLERVLSEREVPIGLRDGIINYLVRRLPPGHFMCALLENNLLECFNRADPTAWAAVPNILRFFVNDVPSSCWGTKEKVDAWLNPVERPMNDEVWVRR